MTSQKKATQRRGLIYIAVLLLLAAQMQAPAWQASGSFVPGQLEFIKQTIDEAIDQGLARDVMALNISDTINNRYDRFWNVICGKLENPDTADAVAFVPAYEDHWFWINDYGVGRHFCTVWKGWNCQTQRSYNQGRVIGSFYDKPSGSQIDGWGDFNSFADSGTYATDPWGMAYDLVRNVQSYARTPEVNSAGTVAAVLANSVFTELSVRVCHRSDNEFTVSSRDSGVGYSWVAFATRLGALNLPARVS